MITIADFYIRKDNTRPAIADTLEPPEGVTPNWTGATVRFRMWKPGEEAFKVNVIATSFNSTTRVATYNWLPADTDTTGEFYAYWHVTEADGSIWTFPNYNNRRISITESPDA